MNTTKTKEKVFPFEYDGWDESGGDYGDIVFYNVQFTDNFGPIKKGDKFDSVFVMHCLGVISCCNKMSEKDNDGFCILTEEIYSVKFKAIPV